MKLAIPDVEYRLNDLQGQVYAACRLGAWCFDENKYLFNSTAPHKSGGMKSSRQNDEKAGQKL